jgi:ABC-type nickel/cobalt efflux system permease component RcnA
MVVFGSIYFARGWPNKGIATILFEVSSIILGLFGLFVLWITGLFASNQNKKMN